MKPGKYKVQILLDNENKIEEEIVILKDPNSENTENDFANTEGLQLKLLDKIREAKSIATELESSISSKKYRKNKSVLLKEKLNMLITKEGAYMQPMLIDQLKYLYSMITRADQVLGNDAYYRFDTLSLELEKIKKSLKIWFHKTLFKKGTKVEKKCPKSQVFLGHLILDSNI